MLAPAIAHIPPSLCGIPPAPPVRLCAGSAPILWGSGRPQPSCAVGPRFSPGQGAARVEKASAEDGGMDPPESTVRRTADAELSGLRGNRSFDALHAASSAAALLIDCSNDRPDAALR